MKLRRSYEAFARGDLVTVMEAVDPDIEIEIHTGRPDFPGTGHGHEAFLENLRQLMEVFGDFRVEPEEFIEVGDHVVVVIHTAGRGRASGIAVTNRVAHVWTVHEGKATRFRAYGSKKQALEAVGPKEPPSNEESKEGRERPKAILGPNSDPQGITAGADGALWFVEHNGNKIGRITTNTAPPRRTCRVPRVRRKSLKAAKLAIRRAHCAVGNVKRTRSRKIRRGRVISQRPKPGTRRPNSAKVKLTVSKGSRR